MTVPAILGTARLGNFRLGYQSAALAAVRATRVRILMAGADVRVRVSGLSIHDLLNESPNTCSLNIDSPAPSSGQALKIWINSNDPQLLFAGKLQTDDLTFEGKPTQLVYPCSAIDDTARLNMRRPIGTWTDISVTTIVQEIVASFAPAFTTDHVAASLPTTTITFDGSEDFATCLGRLATAIGGYFKVEDLDVWLFQTDPSGEPPEDLDSSAVYLLHDPPITVSRDDSQLRTRVYGKGHAEAVPIDIAAGETVIPVDDAVMYNPGGGQVIASTTPDGAASEILTYTGTTQSGAGTIAGPGALPSVAPTATIAQGSGLSVGTYKYAFTFVTAAGESLPSPLASVAITAGGVADPTVAPTKLNQPNAGAFNSNTPIGEAQLFVYTYSTKASFVDFTEQTLPSPSVANTTISNSDPLNPTRSAPVRITMPNSTDARVKTIFIYLKSAESGGTVYRLTASLANNTAGGTSSYDTAGTTAGSQAAPGSNTSAEGKRVDLSGIAIGGTGTTQRKVYRTVADGSQLKLQQTIANNTATVGVQDSTVDGSLGANVPTSDTSGLTQPSGQINAGSTTIRTSGVSGLATSGWLFTPAGDIIRYTGTSGNDLTGIPASGAGSITTTIFYEDQLVPVPALTGVTGLTKALQRGAPVHIWVQRDDLVAQLDAATRESTDDYTSDGIHEYTITDERRGEDSLIDICDANLLLFSQPIVTVTYATRDVRTKSGKTIVINLTNPPISETLTIQDVGITEIDIASGLPPRFSVVASSVRFTIEDVLRRLAA